jgi:hypothetical protein
MQGEHAVHKEELHCGPDLRDFVTIWKIYSLIKYSQKNPLIARHTGSCAVAQTCHPTYMGSVNKRIIVQISLGIKVRTLFKK